MKTLAWQENDKALVIIDQTQLPQALKYIECRDYQRIILAIQRLEVRGAPAIGAAAAYGMLLAAQEFAGLEALMFFTKLEQAKAELAASRPTAVNLFWALERIWQNCVEGQREQQAVIAKIQAEAEKIYQEDVQVNKKIGQYGAQLLPDNCSVLTHCNAGALATCGWGTALGVIREAQAQKKLKMVYADETRPLLQGARLTAWELNQAQIPVTLITDSMAGWVMKQGLVDAIIVGADRVALNGDTANKIGTYTLAVLAKRHQIPFYIATPKSTIDFSIKTGEEIPIEQRGAAEITHLAGIQTAPLDIKVYNPAFDVTPNELISGIITEYGVLTAPYEAALNNIKNKHIF